MERQRVASHTGRSWTLLPSAEFGVGSAPATRTVFDRAAGMSHLSRFVAPGDAEVPILAHSSTGQPPLAGGELGDTPRAAAEPLWSHKGFGHPQTAAGPAFDQGTVYTYGVETLSRCSAPCLV